MFYHSISPFSFSQDTENFSLSTKNGEISSLPQNHAQNFLSQGQSFPRMILEMAQLLRLPCFSCSSICIPSISLPKPTIYLSLHPSSTSSTLSISIPKSSLFPLHPRLSGLHLTLSSSGSSPVLTAETSPAESGAEEFSDSRLVVQNVPWTSTAEDVRGLFDKYGKVVDVELSMYNKTRNRGLAFVELGSPEEAAEALKQLDGSEFEGRVLKLNYAKPKKKKSPPPQPRPPLLFNLFVANLPYSARDKDLKELFASNGAQVVVAEIIFHDNPRRSSGYGFVSFATKKEADAALSSFEGKELMGRPIRVARSKRFVKVDELVGNAD